MLGYGCRIQGLGLGSWFQDLRSKVVLGLRVLGLGVACYGVGQDSSSQAESASHSLCDSHRLLRGHNFCYNIMAWVVVKTVPLLEELRYVQYYIYHSTQ